MDTETIANLHLGLGDEFLSGIEKKKIAKGFGSIFTKPYNVKSLNNKILFLIFVSKHISKYVFTFFKIIFYISIFFLHFQYIFKIYFEIKIQTKIQSIGT